MSNTDLRSNMTKAILKPYKIPGYLMRRVDHLLNTVQGSRVVWPEPGRALLEPFELRRPAGTEVLVLTHDTLVSPGTEGAMFSRLPNTSVQYPYWPGYSGAGEILMVGDQVTNLRSGDRVAAILPHASIWLLDAGSVRLIPENVSLQQASFYQLGIIALQGIRRAQIRFGESVAILGPGLIGQMAIQLAATVGAYPITAIGSSQRRLPLALENGASRVINLAQERDALETIQADVTIDATGNPEAIHDAIRCTRPGGRMVLLGSNRGTTRSMDFDLVREAGITLMGSHIMTLPQLDRSVGRWPAAKEGEVFLGLLADKRLDVGRLLTDEILPSEAELFYRRLTHRDPTILGAVFDWERLPQVRRFASARPELSVGANMFESVAQSLSVGLPAFAVNNAQLVRKRLSLQRLNSNLRVGLIGCGEIAVANAAAIQGASNASIAMVMDVNRAVAEDMAQRYAVPFTTDADEILGRTDVDAVLISVPHYLHAPLTIQAAQHGKHVMVEKPMTTSLADADRMIMACEEAGVTLSVMYCQRYLPYVQKAKQLIDQGALGDLLGIHLIHFLDKPVSYWSSGRTGRVATDWRTSKEKSGGGILVFNIVHYLDIMRYLSGLEALQVNSDFGTFDSPVETEDTLSMTLRYGKLVGADSAPIIANVTAVSCVRGATLAHQRLHIWGTDGQIVVGEPFQFYSLRQIEDYSPGEWHTLTEWEWGVERRVFVQRFATAVLNNEAFETDGHAGRAVQAIVEAAYRSGELRKAVEIETELR